jgi:hypothetical protein
MLHAFLDGIAVALIVSLVTVIWLGWRSGYFGKDLYD